MKRKYRVIVWCIALVVIMSLMSGASFAAGENELTIIPPAFDFDGKGVTDWGSYKAIDIFCNNVLTDLAYGADIGVLNDYITINGVLLSFRASKDASLGLGDMSGLYDRSVALNVLDSKSFRIFYCGGGTGDLNPDAENIVVFAANMPVGAGTLGRTITMVMDPATGVWTEEVEPTTAPTEQPTDQPTQPPEATATTAPTDGENPTTGDPGQLLVLGLPLASAALLVTMRKKR